MERRVVFPGWLFPLLLLGPQLAVTFIFFFWPAGQAILQSVQRGDAFGLSTRFVGLENFAAVLGDPFYLASVEITGVFSIAVAVLALASGLLFAVMADRVVRGAAFYKTVLLLPYVIAGMLWLFLFNPSVGIVAAALRRADDARSRHGPSRQLFRRARSGDGRHQRPAGRGDDAEHPRHGARHRQRQDRDLATLGLCGRVLSLCAAPAVLLGDLRHLDAAGRGADHSDLQRSLPISV